MRKKRKAIREKMFGIKLWFLFLPWAKIRIVALTILGIAMLWSGSLALSQIDLINTPDWVEMSTTILSWFPGATILFGALSLTKVGQQSFDGDSFQQATCSMFYLMTILLVSMTLIIYVFGIQL